MLAALLQVALIHNARDHSPIRKRYLTFLLFITGWSFAYTLWRVSSTEAYALYYCNVLISAAIFEPVAFYHFALELSGRRSKFSVRLGYLGGFLLVLTVPFGLIVEGVSAKFGHQYWPDAGVLMPVYLLFFNAYLIAAVVVLCRGWLQNLGGKASDYMLVLCCAAIGFTGGATNFPLWYDIPIQPYGNILVSIYLFLMVHGLYHNRMFGFSLDIYKAFVGIMLNVSVTLFYLLFLVLYRSYSGQSVSLEDFWLQAIVAFTCSALVFWGAPILKYRTENILDGVFRKDRENALSELKELPMKIADLPDEQSTIEEVGGDLLRLLDVAGVAVYRLDLFEGHYCCKFLTGKFSRSPKEYSIAADSAIIAGMSHKPEVLILAQLYGDLEERYYTALVQLHRDLNISAIIPIFADHEIYGVILLGALRERQSFSDEESSILYNLGSQVGLNLRTRDLERRANEVDKLVALGTMAAGLSHEIRNPLVSVQTMASMLQSGRPLTSLTEEFRAVLLRDVKRIANIVEGVADYSKNQDAKTVPVSLLSIIQGSVDISKPLADEKGIEFVFDANIDKNVEVLANQSQLMQVFNNLIENAFFAMKGISHPKLSIQVGFSTMNSPGRESLLEVVVSDNGAGIHSSILDRIFDPFITSKDTGTRQNREGMGLGLAISKRIIESHNGKIVASNNMDGGATFIVSLKVFKTTQ